MTPSGSGSSNRRIAVLLVLGLFIVYNRNGREIGSFDSQPRKYAARELLLRGTLSRCPLMVAVAAGTRVGLSRRYAALAGGAALAWSLGVAAVGAFDHPNGEWNTAPAGIDRHHERLWDWRDMQIVRCWRAGPSPQNFNLFHASAFRGPDR